MRRVLDTQVILVLHVNFKALLSSKYEEIYPNLLIIKILIKAKMNMHTTSLIDQKITNQLKFVDK